MEKWRRKPVETERKGIRETDKEGGDRDMNGIMVNRQEEVKKG